MEAKQRPRTDDEVYSNFDHVLDVSVVALLESETLRAHHAAWDFSGQVYKQDGRWFEEIRCYGAVVDLLEGDSAEDVIEQANAKYGDA